ncbi:ferrous iron transporter B [Rheinheimera sp. SA_1]|uniref:ferrous iron transporter B n=1 Tax=Rheinheimera sp. SA_1 TaxID=1827365 RepID=UPI000800FA40|nr:ferrous iron transporter B [Rheinheimera sp. SA_1]OBP14405.1 ferrous iron transporter B [Rheinheimera sp. SA_1]
MKRIILVGKPNSGKSLLFNQLTGLRQKVANFPGVTVELKTGRFDAFELVDFPGTYSMSTLSRDEDIAVEKINQALLDDNTALIICNLDATRLESSLVFGMQMLALAQRFNKKLLFALNMIDEVERFGHHIDVNALAADVGCPVSALSAKTLLGISEFKQQALALANSPTATSEPVHNATTANIAADVPVNPLVQSRKLAAKYGIKASIVLKTQNRIDAFMLNNVSGSIAFLLVMFLLFQSIFTFATPLMDGVESALGALAQAITGMIGPGMLSDFLNDAIFGGLGSFLVFVPQIMVLTLIIGLLEDSGYLARAALICHRPLSYFGLSGRSFIPYLSAHACAIPAIMAARTIESPRKRLITMLTIPLMSCSARLPVYALLISVLIPPQQYLGGLINLQGVAFFSLYLFGILTALLVSLVLSRTANDDAKSDMPFILELPTYRLPHWKPLIHRVVQSAKQFIYRAGPVIFVVSLVIWLLGYFPSDAGGLEYSYLGQIGHFIEPLFTPLGIDWRYGIAILMSFLAREVFVGALGTLFGIEGADENIAGLAANIQQDGLAFGAGIGILLFYVVALQCVATVATLKAETGSTKLVLGLVAGYGTLAYLLAFMAASLIG